MGPVFFIIVGSPDDGRTIAAKIKVDYSRFPTEEAIDRLLSCLKEAGKLLDLPRHELTGKSIIIQGTLTMFIWEDVYIVKHPPWLGVTSIASDASNTELYQYVTVADADNEAFKYDTYERATQLAELAESINLLGFHLFHSVPLSVKQACISFKEHAENILLQQAQQGGASVR